MGNALAVLKKHFAVKFNKADDTFTVTHADQKFIVEPIDADYFFTFTEGGDEVESGTLDECIESIKFVVQP